MSHYRRKPILTLITMALVLAASGCVSGVVKKKKVDEDVKDAVDAVLQDIDALALDDGIEPGDGVQPDADVAKPDDSIVDPIDLFPDLAPQETAVVGGAGGTFTLTSGVTLVVPAGALSKEVTLSVVGGGEGEPEGTTPVTDIFVATPDGQKFSKPITLRLPLTKTDLDADQWPLVQGYVGEDDVFESVSAWPDVPNQEVWIQTTHFSLLLAALPPVQSVCLEHELCDGKDNDCDNQVDEAADLITTDDVTGCKSKGVCTLEVVAECVDGAWSCHFEDPENPPPFYEADVELSCDAKDNDCDGLVDEGLSGKISALTALGVTDIDCDVAGICAGANILAACYKKSETTADWLCDYSAVAGYEGGKELTCDGLDNDCDGSVDEGICGQFEPCQDDEACGSGKCVAPLVGSDETFCTSEPDGCLVVAMDATLVEIESGGSYCVDGLEHHLATCENGLWQEPFLDCADLEPINPTCDVELRQCTGGCKVNSDCSIYQQSCTGVFLCQDGQCVEDENTGPLCHKQNWTCQEFTCNPANGECVPTALNNGVACDDGDLCTGAGTCDDGSCAGAVEKQCNDSNPCTDDYCNSETGSCVYDAAPMTGAPCDDNSVCTSNDVCSAEGVCGGQPKLCDDGNVCTADGCNPQTGNCTFELTPGEACDDGDLCTTPGTCSAIGKCVTQPITCDDFNSCTKDECVLGECKHTVNQAVQLCPYPTAEAGKQDLCIPLGNCDAQGICQAGQDLCDCHSDEDCIEQDDNLCDGIGDCEVGAGGLLVCVDQPGTVVICDSGADTDCLVNTCDPANGECSMTPVAAGTPCDDGDLCTTDDQCQAGSCVGTTPVVCDDENPCTKDACLPAQGCVTSPELMGTACEDGDPCTLLDKCNNAGTCLPGSPKNPPCDDGDLCTIDTCTPNGSACVYNPIPGCCTDNTDCNEVGGEFCTDENVCCAPACTDDQGSPFECGEDGCGGTCGTCNPNAICVDGGCCYPNCYSPAKQCGDDGCGGSCGFCGQGNVCTEFNQCCTPQCGGKECGPDGCGETCGSCSKGFKCNTGVGLCEVCTPVCNGKECGDDGCGDVCGTCQEGAVCTAAGLCCVPNCAGKVCGDDGCGGVCGSCDDWETCTPAGQCSCTDCCVDDKECDAASLCVGEVVDGEEMLTICEEPITSLFDDFEDHFPSVSPTGYAYSFEGTTPWTIRFDTSGFWTHSGKQSFRYYRVPVDLGGYFSFTRYLPELGEGELARLSFFLKCNSAPAPWTLKIMAGNELLSQVDSSVCNKQWHRYLADVSHLAGPTEFRFITNKTQAVGVEILIDDMAIFVSHCPDGIPCATMGPVNNACSVQSIDNQTCFIDQTCYGEGDFHPTIECAFCESAFSQTKWQTDDSLCDDGNPGTQGICDLTETMGCYFF